MKLIKNMLITSVGLVLASSVFAKNNKAQMEVSFQILESCVIKSDINIINNINTVKDISINIKGTCSDKSNYMIISEKLNSNKKMLYLTSLSNEEIIKIGKNESIIVNIIY